MGAGGSGAGEGALDAEDCGGVEEQKEGAGKVAEPDGSGPPAVFADDVEDYGCCCVEPYASDFIWQRVVATPYEVAYYHHCEVGYHGRPGCA